MLPLFAQQSNLSGTLRLTLEDCLNYAFGNSLTRQKMQLSEQSYEAGYNQSKLERLPNLSASVSENVSHTQGSSANWRGNYDIDASITLYQGGSINNTIKQNKLYTEQASLQTSQYDNELIIRILQSFLNVLGYEELLKYQESVIKASEEQLKQGVAQYKAGKILESDYLMLEAQLASDKDNIVDTRANRDNGLLSLKGLLSMDMNYDLQIIYPDTSAIEAMSFIPTKDDVIDQTMNTLPDLEILRYGVNIAEVNLKISRSGYAPTVSLSGGIGTGHQENYNNFGTQLSDRFNQQVGLTLNIPIFNRGRTKTKVTQGKIALQQAKLDQQQGELDILQTVTQEYMNVNAALSKFRSSSIKENAYRRTFEAYREQFNVGAITAVDLLQQQNNYISALNDYVQSKYSFMLKRKILDVYMGKEIKM